jgi:hypothetical protein
MKPTAPATTTANLIAASHPTDALNSGDSRPGCANPLLIKQLPA